jgi:hypothetical protein
MLSLEEKRSMRHSFVAALLAALSAVCAHAGLAFCPCPADLNGDGEIDGADLGLLLADWDEDGPADLNYDGRVDGADLGLLLTQWGPCGGDHPINDQCVDGLQIGGKFVPVPFCTTGATGTTGFTGLCNGQLLNDVHYFYEVPETGTYRVKVYGATFDARVLVVKSITGLCEAAGQPPAAWACTTTPIPDWIEVGGGDGFYVEFEGVKGDLFGLRVGSPTGATGTGALMIETPFESDNPCTVISDFTPRGGGSTSIGTFFNYYPSSIPSSCGDLSQGPDIWSAITSGCPDPFTLRIGTCTGFSFFDTVVTVYIGDPCGDLFELACSDDVLGDRDCLVEGQPVLSELFIEDAQPNTTYYIRLTPAPGVRVDSNDQYGLDVQIFDCDGGP